jgi:hypothetical protein
LIGIPQAETHLFQIFVVDVACDYLWFIRNKAHHDGLILNALIISFTINKTVLEHHSAWKTKLVPSCKVWKSPPSFSFKINYDTTIQDTFSAQVAVCRDSSGSIIKCVSFISSPCSPIYGEAFAAFLETQLATFLGLTNFIFRR